MWPRASESCCVRSRARTAKSTSWIQNTASTDGCVGAVQDELKQTHDLSATREPDPHGGPLAMCRLPASWERSWLRSGQGERRAQRWAPSRTRAPTSEVLKHE